MKVILWQERKLGKSLWPERKRGRANVSELPEAHTERSSVGTWLNLTVTNKSQENGQEHALPNYPEAKHCPSMEKQRYEKAE